MAENRTEILAPAGTYDALVAGVRCGADAVYLGTKAFNARQGAGNFDGDELTKAVSFCHMRGVRVHVTLNTLVSDGELSAAIDELEHVCASGADVLILQDLGLSALVKKCAPDISRHASTQMSVQTAAGVRLLERLGFSRVVLPRELSKGEITEISQKSSIETECFVHGALCMCVSGQCYLSAMLGSRSGNRGLCAQPCRLPFMADNGTGFDLSLKDLSYVKHIKELADIGVVSFKIEGRMKRPEYVAAAVTACRKSLKGEGFESDSQALKAVFSRSGFTNGYYSNLLGRDMFGTRRKEDVVSANEVLSGLERLYDKERQSVPVDFELTVKDGEPITLAAASRGKYAFITADESAQKAINTPSTALSLSQRLSKCGGTPFYVKSCEVDIDEGLIVPASVVNGLRRQALEELTENLSCVKPNNFTRYNATFDRHIANPRKTYAFFMDANTVPDDLCGLKTIFVPYDTNIERLNSIKSKGVEVGVAVPRGLFSLEEKMSERLKELFSEGIKLAYCQNLDAVELALEAGMQVHTGFGLNIFNTVSLEVLEAVGVKEATLSFEMTLSQAKRLCGQIPRGIIAYGRLPLMLTRNCPIKNGGGCASCGKKGYITDRMGVRFPIRCSGACSEILNSRPVWLADRLHEIENMDFITLYFTTETKKECAEIIDAYVNGNMYEISEYTRGLYYRGVK